MLDCQMTVKYFILPSNAHLIFFNMLYDRINFAFVHFILKICKYEPGIIGIIGNIYLVMSCQMSLQIVTCDTLDMLNVYMTVRTPSLRTAPACRCRIVYPLTQQALRGLVGHLCTRTVVGTVECKVMRAI
jgi:hypothetical protein